MKLIKAENSAFDYVRRLYLSSFPPIEQRSIRMLTEKQQSGDMELYAVEDEGKYVGLAFVVLYGDMVLLDYLAIDKALRGRGYGTGVLSLVREHFAGRRIFLEIESTKEDCRDIENRLRRKHFYVENGMTAMDFEEIYYGVRMEVLTFGCRISYDEYHAMITSVFGQRHAAHQRLLYDNTASGGVV